MNKINPTNTPFVLPNKPNKIFDLWLCTLPMTSKPPHPDSIGISLFAISITTIHHSFYWIAFHMGFHQISNLFLSLLLSF